VAALFPLTLRLKSGKTKDDLAPVVQKTSVVVEESTVQVTPSITTEILEELSLKPVPEIVI
jgi:hypothetical protein